MPLLDSFCVNHIDMPAPALRVAKNIKTPKGDDITVYDMRFCKPNKTKMSTKGIHTMEHLFAGFLRDYLENDHIQIIDCSPMGCKTGFYMSMIGKTSDQNIITAWEKSMKDVIKVKSKKDIPELNIYQCGSYKLHSLKQAKKIAKDILEKKITVMDNEKLKLDESYINI
ncbi:MAG: S-ribosylhomocysteine lyase [Campylobacteraceae bacterium 4484_166]|nr:MAG: S-ribosylhomocysteine lyase [Campylobacteraceae bacterium 4484_166]